MDPPQTLTALGLIFFANKQLDKTTQVMCLQTSTLYVVYVYFASPLFLKLEITIKHRRKGCWEE